MTKVNKVKDSTTDSKELMDPADPESGASTSDFECDTFFPLDLESPEAENLGWRKRDRKELEALTGEEFGSGERDRDRNGNEDRTGDDGGGNTQGVSGIRMREGDIEYEFCLYER